MAWERGKDVLVKVDVSATMTALTGEISSTLNMSADTLSAANKATSGWKGKAVTGKEWNVQASGNVDTTSNPALAAIEAAFIAETAIDCQFVEANGSTYDGSAVVTSFSKSAPSDGFLEASFTLEGDGALTPS